MGRIEQSPDKDSHGDEHAHQQQALLLTPSSLCGCYLQLLIDHNHPGLLEGTLQVSLSTQFPDTALLQGKSDIPHSIRFQFWMKALELLYVSERSGIAVMAMAHSGTLVNGSGRRIVRGRHRAGRSGLLRMPALSIDTWIA
jgi:hypothetical protein